MNNIDISCYDIEEPEWISEVEKYCIRILFFLEKSNWEISIMFTDNQYIRKLNREYRQKDEPTDVLSFCQKDGDEIPSAGGLIYAGDIVISLEYLEKSSKEQGIEPIDELKRLILHGILHLDGHDHKTNDPDEKMIIYQEEILKKIGEEW